MHLSSNCPLRSCRKKRLPRHNLVVGVVANPGMVCDTVKASLNLVINY